MKINIEIDTVLNEAEDIKILIDRIFAHKIKNTHEQPKQENGDNDVSIVVRDGEEKTTESVKDDLKRLGFNYYKFKKNSKKEDPRWTQTCEKSYWEEIKDHSVLEGLNVWTSLGVDNES